MRLDCVETFWTAASLRSVSEASRRLNMVQTTASAQIMRLERDLDRTLLDRRPDRRFRLTADGQRFLGEAEKLMSMWRRIKTDFHVTPKLPAILRVGVIESVLHSWLVPWVETLRKERPELHMELTVETTPTLIDSIRRGGLDLAVATRASGGEGIRTRALEPMPMIFAGSRRGHGKRSYTLRQIAELGLLTFQRGSQPQAALRDLLRAEKVEDTRVHAVSSVSAMARMVASGFGVATLPLATLDDPLIGTGLRSLRCSTSLAPLPVHVSWRHDPLFDDLTGVIESAVKAASQSRGKRPGRRKTQ